MDFLYLMTLPEDKQVAAKEPDDVDSDDLRRVVTRTIQMLRDPAQKRRRPLLAVRNLYTLLDQETFSNIEKLNEVLWPYWNTLWRVCARGHYAVHRKPLRPKPAATTMTLKPQCSADCHPKRKADIASIWCEKRGTISLPTCIFLAHLRHAIR